MIRSLHKTLPALALASLFASHAQATCGLKFIPKSTTVYAVSSYADLKKVGVGDCALSAAYRLTADIDASPSATENLSGTVYQGFTPIGTSAAPFTGKFHGAGFAIRHLSIQRASTDRVGLFGQVYYANFLVDSLDLESVAIVGHTYVGALIGYQANGLVHGVRVLSGSVAGNDQVGGLVGYHEGTIMGVRNRAQVTATVDYLGGIAGKSVYIIDSAINQGTVSGKGYVGGIAGLSDQSGRNAYIRHSGNMGSVTGTGERVGGIAGRSYLVDTCWNTGAIQGSAYVGGIAGYQFYTVTSSFNTGRVLASGDYAGGISGYHTGPTFNSYNTGYVQGKKYVGGIAGYLVKPNTIEYSYSTGAVSGTSSVGGLVGYTTGGTVTASYWNTETSGQASSAGGTGLTTVQMLDPNSWTSFDLTRLWTLAGGYPALRVQANNAPFAFADSLLANTQWVKASRFLANDRDAESTSPALVYRIQSLLGAQLEQDGQNVRFVAGTAGGTWDSLNYRIGELMGSDTLWGNEAKLRLKMVQFQLTAPSGSITYGDAPLTLSASAQPSSLVPVLQSMVPSVATVSGDQVTIVGAGTTEIQATVIGTNMGSLSTGVSLTVLPKAITVVAKDARGQAGSALPVFTYAVTGLINKDRMTGALALGDADPDGKYPILLGSLSAGGNYTIEYTGALYETFTVALLAPLASVGGETNASVYDLQGHLVWTGTLDVANGRFAMPPLEPGSWLVRLRQGSQVRAVVREIR